jgi:hypothetical protein
LRHFNAYSRQEMSGIMTMSAPPPMSSESTINRCIRCVSDAGCWW